MNPVTSTLLRHLGCYAVFSLTASHSGVSAAHTSGSVLRAHHVPVPESDFEPSANSDPPVTGHDALPGVAEASTPALAGLAQAASDPLLAPVVEIQNSADDFRLASASRNDLGLASSQDVLYDDMDKESTSSLLDGISITSMIFGIVFVCSAVSVLWFNENQNAKMDTLLARGLQECITVDAKEIDKDTHGFLIHTQGNARGAVELMDSQFEGAKVKTCIKLQSTVEVFEWVQVTRIWLEGKERKSQPKFNSEWTTFHHDSTRFRKPSPENPRLPHGLCLGTNTHSCPRVELGNFVLPDSMLQFFHNYEPAMGRLPSTLVAHGLTFFANQQDGYFYARPSMNARSFSNSLFTDHHVGDFRARFMCVPECAVTVVAVQSGSSRGFASFVPYRPIPHGICQTAEEARQKLVFEGSRSLFEFKQDVSCCHGGLATCFCCVCNTLACFFSSEVVTEEIFYISDKLEPREKPFKQAVPRNRCRSWSFRIGAMVLLYLGLAMLLEPCVDDLLPTLGLDTYGNHARLVLYSSMTLAVTGLIISISYMFYLPLQGLKWLVITAGIIAAPLAGSTLQGA